MISLSEKVNEEVEANTTHVDEAVTTANGASQKATKASEDVQKAITEANTTLQAANAAKVSAQASATASAGSASAAAGSASAASGSAANAAASAKAAEDIAAGIGGFDGTAASVKATDTQGLVVAAGADSNAQALLDALAHKVALELVSNTALTTKLADYLKKTDIVQTESTATNKVPSSAYLKQVKDSIDSNLEELSNRNDTWTLVGSVTGKNILTLPEKYNDLLCYVDLQPNGTDNDNINQVFYSNRLGIGNGMRMEGGSKNNVIYLLISQTQVSITYMQPEPSPVKLTVYSK